MAVDWNQVIPLSEYPCWVWSDHNSDVISSLIKIRTKANYSHVMIMIAPGVCASQGFTTYSKVPIQNYMHSGNRLKFIGLNGVTPEGRKQIIASVERKLKSPWYRKIYDWLGIVGQITGATWIQTPFFDFCSEDAFYHVQKTELEYPTEFTLALSEALRGLPKNGSPGKHDEYSKQHRDVFPVLFKWSGDEKDG